MTNPADKKTWFGHPRPACAPVHHRDVGTLRLLRHAGAAHALSDQAFLFSDQQATGLYGGYTALVYLTPLVGGFIADQYLGLQAVDEIRRDHHGDRLFHARLRRLAREALSRRSTASATRSSVDNFMDRPTSDPNEARFIVDHGQKLQIRGNDDGVDFAAEQRPGSEATAEGRDRVSAANATR